MSIDDEILDALRAGDAPAWLFTVAATWGSSPRPPGSLLLVDETGRQTGSVSGGCVEEDLVARVRCGEFQSGCPRVVSYGVTKDEARRFGLPCGGRLDLLVERIEERAPWRLIARAVSERRTLARRVCLDTGEVSLHPGEAPELRWEPGFLARSFGPRWQLIIIGASHIARCLVPIAHDLGYRVVVCDPRQDQAAAWDLAEAELDTRMPDDVVRERADDPRSAVVALTHDPRLDDMALMEALTGRAFYVGALGSRRSQEARRERLSSLGLSEEAVGRLHGPVGLRIGGRTPPEIAVSIAAELISVRHARAAAAETT